MDKQEIVVKEFNGFAIQIIEGKEVNLTNMWKAVGSPSSKDLDHWFRNDSINEFIDELSKKLNTPKSGVLKTQRGRYFGGTWAHWQVALEYARYLSAELAMMMNRVFKERLEEEVDPELGINRAYERAIKTYKKRGKDDKWIAMRFKTLFDTKKFHSSIGKRGGYGTMYGKCHNAIYKHLLGGSTQEIREQRQLSKSANIRDNMTIEELSAVNLTELLVMKRFDIKDVQSGQGCVKACDFVAQNIAQAMSLSLM